MLAMLRYSVFWMINYYIEDACNRERKIKQTYSYWNIVKQVEQFVLYYSGKSGTDATSFFALFGVK